MKKLIFFCLSLIMFSSFAHADAIHSNDLDEIIKNEKKPLIVEFSETWCGYCKLSIPFVKKLEQEKDFDVVTLMGASESIKKKYHVSGFPTFILIKDGQPYGSVSGYNKDNTVQSFRNWIFNNKLTESTLDDMCTCGCGHTVKNCDCKDM